MDAVSGTFRLRLARAVDALGYLIGPDGLQTA
jgi:hypothetical protein